VFIESFKEPPEELILDFDKTNAEVHAEAVLNFLVDKLKREWPAVGIIRRRGGNPDVRAAACQFLFIRVMGRGNARMRRGFFP
jgi:hypothetical protein